MGRISPRLACAAALPSIRTSRRAPGAGTKVSTSRRPPGASASAAIFQPIPSGRRISSSAGARRRPLPGESSEIQRLFYMTSHLRTDASTPVPKWKLLLAKDCKTQIGEPCDIEGELPDNI